MAHKKQKQRNDGRYERKISAGISPDGKPITIHVYGKSLREVNRKRDKVRERLGKGLRYATAEDTFKQWSDRWLIIKQPEICDRQYASYKSLLKHLNRKFENIPIDKINSVDIQELLAELAILNPNTNKPASKQTLKMVRSTAVQIFQLAIDSRLIDYNPALSTKVAKNAPTGKRRALTATEQEWIRDTPHRAQTSAMLMMYAGLRRGELVALTWSDIDLFSATITVDKAAEVIKGHFVTKDMPKTDAGIRTIDIPRILVTYLKTVKRDSLLVTTKIDGTMHTESSFRRMWESYLKDLNFNYGDFSFLDRPKSKFDPEGVPFVIPQITPHWLRHTFATMLYLAGVDYLTAKEQMGHSNIKTTLDIYTHLDKLHKRKSMNKLDDYIDGNTKSRQKVVRTNV